MIRLKNLISIFFLIYIYSDCIFIESLYLFIYDKKISCKLKKISCVLLLLFRITLYYHDDHSHFYNRISDKHHNDYILRFVKRVSSIAVVETTYVTYTLA